MIRISFVLIFAFILLGCNEEKDFSALFEQEIVSIKFEPVQNFDHKELRIEPVLISKKEQVEKLISWAISGKRYSKIDTSGYYQNRMIVSYKNGDEVAFNVSCPLKESGGIMYKHLHFLVDECPDLVEFRDWRKRYEEFRPNYDLKGSSN